MAISMLKDGKVTPLEEERDDVSPHTEPEGEEQPQDAAELLKNSPPEDPLAAAIDKATGFADAAKAGAKVRLPVVKRDWVEEAYKCFIKDAGDIDPTDPVKAIDAYFQKNATDELKARCKAEGKDAKGCWKFIEAVARKALGNRSGHIDPGVIYAIAMHWFEDVPKDWDSARPQGARRQVAETAKPKKPTTRKERLEERVAHGSSKAKAELRELKKKERTKAKAAKAKKPKQQQGFFFEMLEMQSDGPNKDGPSSPQASAGAPGEENAMEPSSLPASTSSTESEMQG